MTANKGQNLLFISPHYLCLCPAVAGHKVSGLVAGSGLDVQIKLARQEVREVGVTHQSPASPLGPAPQPLGQGLTRPVDDGAVQEGRHGVDLVTLVPGAVGGGPGEVQTLLTKLTKERVILANVNREAATEVPIEISFNPVLPFSIFT